MPISTPIRYLLEHQKPDGTSTFFELSWCMSIDFSLPMLSRIDWPIASGSDAVVQFTRYRNEVITLSGETGQEDRYATDDAGETRSQTAVERIGNLRAFLRSFTEAASKTRGWYKRSVNNDKLLFHALYEQASWEVAKVDIKINAASGKNLGDFGWSLDITTVKRLGQAYTTAVSPLAKAQDDLAKQEKEKAIKNRLNKSFGSEWLDKYKEPSVDDYDAYLNNSISSLESDDADFLTLAERAVVKGTVALRILSMAMGRVRAQVMRVNRLLNRFNELRQEFQRIMSFPTALITNSLLVVTQAVDELQQTAEALPSVDSLTRDTLIDLQVAWSDFSTELMAELGIRGLPIALDAQATDLSSPTAGNEEVTPRPTSRVVYALGYESLSDIAARVFGDPDRWRDIAELNGIIDPWELNNGSPIAPAGTAFRVPFDVGSSSTADDLIGQSYYITEDGDLAWDGTGYRRIGGSALIIQAITERGKSVRKPSALFPQWGLLPTVGETLFDDDVARFAVDLKDQMLRDTRVLSVNNLVVERTDDKILATATVYTVNGDSPLKIAAPIATVG